MKNTLWVDGDARVGEGVIHNVPLSSPFFDSMYGVASDRPRWPFENKSDVPQQSLFQDSLT